MKDTYVRNQIRKNNDVYKFGRLNTSCFYQWVDFFQHELFPCTIAPLSAFFNGYIDMVAFESGFIYTKIKASPYRVYFKRKQPCDYFYIIATNGAISWVNKNKEIKSLPLGGGGSV